MRAHYLIVTPFFPRNRDNAGGWGNAYWKGAYCYDFAKALADCFQQKGIDLKVEVFVPGNGSDYNYKGLVVRRFLKKELPCGFIPFWLEKRNQGQFLEKLCQVGIAPKDIVICHAHTSEYAIYPLAIKRENNSCKALLHHHNCEPIRLNLGRFGNIMGYSDLMYHWQRKNCEAIDLHVFCSRKSFETYGKYYPCTPEDEWVDIRSKCLFGRLHAPLGSPRHAILYNGYDDCCYYPDKAEHNGFVIGCVGNFQVLKGQFELLCSALELRKHIPDLKIRFIGSGSTLEDCKRFAKENGLLDIVSFETEVDHAELPQFYRAIDLMVLPSRLEGFCCVYMEASACGVPFIGCRGISCQEVLPETDWKYWLAEPNNVESLTEKILDYYKERRTQKLTRSMKWHDLVEEYVETTVRPMLQN